MGASGNGLAGATGDEGEGGSFAPGDGEALTSVSAIFCLSYGRRDVVRAGSVRKHRALPVGYGLVSFVCFFCFLYLVCLPFSIFGRSFRTFSMSFSVQACTFRLPNWTVLGAGTFFLAMYRLRVPALMP